MAPFPLGILAQAAGGGALGYDHLETVTLGNTSSEIAFTNIPQDYKHLFVKLVTKSASNEEGGMLRFNTDNGSNYTSHYTNAYGSGFNSQQDTTSGILYGYHDNDAFNTSLIEITDYTSTSKYTQIIQRGGAPGGAVRFGTGSWKNTSAVTAVRLKTSAAGSFTAGCIASLYGIG